MTAASTLQQLTMGRCIEEFLAAQSPHWYPAIGEEATLIGCFAGLEPTDFVAPHYRGRLVVMWLRGLSLVDIFRGVRGTTGSPETGRLSGLHRGSREARILPLVTNVLGPNVPTAAGLALGCKLQRGSQVVVVSFGDGTAGLGDLHETLNLAVALRLPLVLVCQNNQYSISTRTASTRGPQDLSAWARAYELPSEQVDGNDVESVAGSVGKAVERARAGDGPSFVDCLTYRAAGHFVSDRGSYRPSEEVAEWAARDPVLIEARRAMAEGSLTEDDFRRLRHRCRREIEDAWEAASSRLAAQEVSV
jgi:acetoin:2,6-dichlorophenolindophenol oxidoreductase subunit alpha